MRDKCRKYVIIQEIRLPPTGTSGVNLNLMYGYLEGFKTTQSDVKKGYVQSWLETAHPMFVELPQELTPRKYAHIHRPCLRLYKSLCDLNRADVKKFHSVAQELGGCESTTRPSLDWFENIEPLTPASRVLGREHIIAESAEMTWIEYRMSVFAESACETYIKFFRWSWPEACGHAVPAWWTLLCRNRTRIPRELYPSRQPISL